MSHVHICMQTRYVDIPASRGEHLPRRIAATTASTRSHATRQSLRPTEEMDIYMMNRRVHHTVRWPITIGWEEYRSSQLFAAAACGRTTSVHKMLSEDVNPDWRSPENGLTPLHIAAIKGHAWCVLSLLRAGADIHATDQWGLGTALDFCIERKPTRSRSSNYKDCIAYLRKAHADCQDRSKVTAYQGFVVVHPGEELGLVRVQEVREEVRAAV